MWRHHDRRQSREFVLREFVLSERIEAVRLHLGKRRQLDVIYRDRDAPDTGRMVTMRWFAKGFEIDPPSSWLDTVRREMDEARRNHNDPQGFLRRKG